MIRYRSSNITISPELALQVLMDGNERFVNGLSINRNLLQQVIDTEHEQKPFAAILSCMDSRAPVELIFDQGIGDIFSIRIAGNIVSENILGSLEYAVEVIGVKLVVVMGHTNCGAVKGACDHIEMGNLTGLLEKIKPAMDYEGTISENRTGKNKEFVDLVSKWNVFHTVNEMLAGSEIIKNAVDRHQIQIAQSMYDVASGKVEFMQELVAV